MLKQMEQLNGHLSSIDGHLATATQHLLALVEAVRSVAPPEEPKLFMADVLTYLGISERSYYRKVASGKLVPRKWEGPDYFYLSDLEAEYAESKRRGRV